MLTQHGKETLLGPLFYERSDYRIQHVQGFNTDKLGSFTGDIPRVGSLQDAVRCKARIGMILTTLPRGIASEGAFGKDPVTGLIPWNTELVIWIDDENGREITGIAEGPARHGQALIQNRSELWSFVATADFPSHHLLLRPLNGHAAVSHKGLADRDSLVAALEK